MIDVRREDLVAADVECILRSVGSRLEPLTAVGREIGAAAGEDLLERVERIGDRKALLNGMSHACRMDIETLALPPLGTGAGNLDAEAAADVMFEVLRGHMESEEYPREVTVMVTTEYELQAFAARLEAAVD